MKNKNVAEPILQEGKAYTIHLHDGRKVTDAIYYACIVSGKPYFEKGAEIFPAEEVLSHSLLGFNVKADSSYKEKVSYDNRQTLTQASSSCEQIKKALRVLGTKELSLEETEQSSKALWWNNKGCPQETMVLAVGLDSDGDLYLTLADGCGGNVQIWESCQQLSENDLKPVLVNVRKYLGKKGDPDRLAITDEAEDVIEVTTTPTVNPQIFRRRVRCLMLSGLSQIEAEELVATTPLQLELFYDVGLGAFAIDAEAVGNTPLFNPYTGKEIPDKTGIEVSDSVQYTLPNGLTIELLSEMRSANYDFGDFDETIEELRASYQKADDKETLAAIESRINEQCDAFADCLGTQYEEIQGLIPFADLSAAIKQALIGNLS